MSIFPPDLETKPLYRAHFFSDLPKLTPTFTGLICLTDFAKIDTNIYRPHFLTHLAKTDTNICRAHFSGGAQQTKDHYNKEQLLALRATRTTTNQANTQPHEPPTQQPTKEPTDQPTNIDINVLVQTFRLNLRTSAWWFSRQWA